MPGAFLASVLFAVHPVNVESVAWITERKNVLSLPLAIAAILSYLRFCLPGNLSVGSFISARRRWRWYGLALVLFGLAILAKTVVVTLPVVLLVLIWWKQGELSARELFPLAPFFAMSLVMGLITREVELNQVGAQGEAWSLDALSRLLLAGRSLWFYVGKLAWPRPLIFFYPHFAIDARQWWQYLFPAAVLVMLFALWVARGRIGRGPLVAALIYLGVLLPMLGFVNIYYMRYADVCDHFQYHACIAAIAAVTAGATNLRARLTKGGKIVASVCAFVMVGALATASWHRVRVYLDSEILFRDTLTKNLRCEPAYGNLALYLDSHERYLEAVEVSRQALSYFPNDASFHNNLAAFLLRQGTRDGFSSGQIDEILDHCQTALRLAPDDVGSLINWGFALIAAQRAQDALMAFGRALKTQPRNIQALYGMGSALTSLGRRTEAHQCYAIALQLAPDEARVNFAVGQLLVAEKRFPEAIPRFEAVVRAAPQIAEAHYELAGALVEVNDLTSAQTHYETAVNLQPKMAQAWNALGMLRLKQGQPAEAVELFREALRRDPNITDARINLDEALPGP